VTAIRLAAPLLALALCWQPASAEVLETIEGQLDIVWGDPHRDATTPAQILLTVTDDRGASTAISVSEELAAAHGGFLSWNGRRVRVHLAESPASTDGTGRIGQADSRPAAALTLLAPRDEDTIAGSVTGSQPWVSILCKFADINAEPENQAFFQGMYGNSFGGLDDYWRKQSYGNIDIVGSIAVDWVDLPEPQSHYVPDPGDGTGADKFGLFGDCTEAADEFVDFSNGGTGGFAGINQMFNDRLDCCAWGGSTGAELDGVNKTWRVTWNPPWAFRNSSVIAHEMGHGFGLPHSNNFDDDGNPYDSPWDVMSSAQGNSVNDGTYGSLGKHHTAYHKNRLGWFLPSEVRDVASGETVTITIDAMSVPTTTNYRMARIDIPGTNDWYTVESRRVDGYDGALPDKAVIISEIDTNRGEPAWAVDIDEPPANYSGNEGTMFRPGETFFDASAQIGISIDAETADGFVVTIYAQTAVPIFTDRFQTP
jgi:hypothetical protein